MNNIIIIILAIFAVILTAYIFYNTIVTKKWRNQAPNESKSWKFGFIYYNPLDKRIFLPKRTGLGITVNFDRPTAVVLTLVIITSIILYILSK